VDGRSDSLKICLVRTVVPASGTGYVIYFSVHCIGLLHGVFTCGMSGSVRFDMVFAPCYIDLVLLHGLTHSLSLFIVIAPWLLSSSLGGVVICCTRG